MATKYQVLDNINSKKSTVLIATVIVCIVMKPAYSSLATPAQPLMKPGYSDSALNELQAYIFISPLKKKQRPTGLVQFALFMTTCSKYYQPPPPISITRDVVINSNTARVSVCKHNVAYSP